MPLPAILTTLYTLLALLLPGAFKSDGWPAWVNGIVSGIIVTLFAAATVWAGGAFTGNVAADWALFTSAYAALLAGPFKPLDSWLQSALNLPFIHPAVVTPTMVIPSIKRPVHGG